MKKSKASVRSAKIANAVKSVIVQNDLASALFPNGGFAAGGGVQLSQWNTLFKNLRYYLVSNSRQLLNYMYVEYGVVSTMVDVPVNDALRGGVTIKSEQLNEDEIKTLQIRLKRDAILRRVVGQAAKWNRLFGGAGIIFVTDQDPETELDLEAIGPDTPLKFIAADMWELFSNQQNTEISDAQTVFKNPMTSGAEFFDYYGVKLHKSRVRILTGLEPPSFIKPRLRGWGYSIVEPVVRDLNQYLKSDDLSFEVLDEFKLDIFKIEGLNTTLLSPNGDAKVRQRVAIGNSQKNYLNALVMDAKDDYQQKQLSFTGLGEVKSEIRIGLASALRMPMTKLFGIPTAGFSSGEDDIENYNAMVESDVREKIEFDVLAILELLCQQEFGMVPDDLEIEFAALRVLSTEQEENVKTQKFSRIAQARQMGEMDSKEFKEACNKDNLVGVQLDVNRDTLEMPNQESDGEGIEAKKDPKAKKSTTQPKEAKS